MSTSSADRQDTLLSIIREYVAPTLGLVALFLTGLYSYRLFQTLADLFSVIVCFSLLMLVWNSRRWMNNDYLFLLGLGWACSGVFDLFRIVANLDMTIFVGQDLDLSIQLWIVARYLQSVTLFIAPFFLDSYGIFRNRRKWEVEVFALGVLLTICLLGLIFFHWFPACYIEGIGFTPFKYAIEIVIISFLFGSIGLLSRQRHHFEESLLRMLLILIGTTVFSELLLVGNFANGWQTLAGYSFKVITFYLIYLAIVRTGLQRPYDLVLRNLEQQERRYRQMFTEHSTIQLLIDPETGAIVQANPAAAKFYGYPVESLQRLNLMQINMLLPEQNMDWMKEARSRTSDHFIFQQRLASGAVRDVEAHAAPIQVSGRDLLYTIIHDITERKRIEKELAQANEDLKRSNANLQRFAYVVSHDLQEPLRTIGSFTQLLAKRYRGKLDTDADEFIGFIVDGLDRMQQLITALLEYSRVGSRNTTVILTNTEESLDQALSNLEIRIAENHALITHSPLPKVMVDSTQMTQLFQNLITNAIKFRSDLSPHVHIQAEQHGEEWIFSIHDNGIGFEPKYAERIFELFQRLHTQQEYSGTGIGLAICKRIVERHGGKMWAESQKGQGATFYFTMPVYAETIP
jgi:PAS domain S-box-containing protein